MVGGYNTFWISPGDSFAVVNGEKRTSIIVDPPDGQVPAMKADTRNSKRRVARDRRREARCRRIGKQAPPALSTAR